MNAILLVILCCIPDKMEANHIYNTIKEMKVMEQAFKKRLRIIYVQGNAYLNQAYMLVDNHTVVVKELSNIEYL